MVLKKTTALCLIDQRKHRPPSVNGLFYENLLIRDEIDAYMLALEEKGRYGSERRGRAFKSHAQFAGLLRELTAG